MGTLELRGVTKTYGAKKAVDDLTIDIGNGEFFVILGPSGAGKTTTLKAVAGLVDIDAGDVSIAGTDMTGVEPYHRNVAMAFESYALYPQKTVAENLASPLKSGRTGNYSEADQKERIDTVTKTLGINHLLNRLPKELSNGQRQRTALGRVLVRPADIYLLDEPLSHLDAKLRASMRAELKALGGLSNTTTLYVTHDYQEALSLGDRVGVMRDGRLVQVDAPAVMWRRPKDVFVARALGQPEMNLVEAVVENGAFRIPGTEVSVPVAQGLDIAQGERVLLGMRPGECKVVGANGEAGSGSVVVPGKVLLAERLGRQTELDIETGGPNLISTVAAHLAPDEGSAVDVAIDLSNIHVFKAAENRDDSLRIGSAAGADMREEKR